MHPGIVAAKEVKQAAIVARTTLVSSVAHDLRGPLGACRSAGKLLRQSVDNIGKVKDLPQQLIRPS